MSVSEDEAANCINEERRGFLGFTSEEIQLIESLWVPCYLFRISHVKEEGLLSKKLTTRTFWNLYDALEGFWLYRFEREPQLTETEAENPLQPKVKDRKIKSTLSKVLRKANEVVTRRAKKRYADKLNELGIPVPVKNVTVDDVTIVHYPFYMALLKKGETHRIISVDGVTGRIHKNMSNVLTRNMHHVLELVAKRSSAKTN